MEFRLVINMDNEAFDTEGYELIRILSKISGDIETNGIHELKKGIMDINGSKVGNYEIS